LKKDDTQLIYLIDDFASDVVVQPVDGLLGGIEKGTAEETDRFGCISNSYSDMDDDKFEAVQEELAAFCVSRGETVRVDEHGKYFVPVHSIKAFFKRREQHGVAAAVHDTDRSVAKEERDKKKVAKETDSSLIPAAAPATKETDSLCCFKLHESSDLDPEERRATNKVMNEELAAFCAVHGEAVMVGESGQQYVPAHIMKAFFKSRGQHGVAAAVREIDRSCEKQVRDKKKDALKKEQLKRLEA
jgi:hypothetical protein